MAELWRSFIFSFCKVDAVCWHGDPNWLGWILLAILAIFLAVVGFLAWVIIATSWDSFDYWASTVGGNGIGGKIVYFVLMSIAVVAAIFVIGGLISFLATNGE